MNISDAKNYFETECASLFEKREADEVYNRVIEHLTLKSSFEIKFDTTIHIDEKKFKDMVTQLKSNTPLQYVIGYEWFYNIKIEVNRDVLIPRPETAELVKWILDTIQHEGLVAPSILDIGTGSGCIPVVLKNEFPLATIAALDISKNALQVAQRNATAYRVIIDFIEADILNNDFCIDKKFDIIVSNPPYITSTERDEMHARVIDFEPKLALFVTNNDPFQFYKAVIHFAKKHLVENGFIFVELNSDYGIETEQLFKQNGYTTELRKDMYGNTRMLMGKREMLDVRC